ncbi:MAG: succinate dehydrogenase assembly factor 2 [Pseudomonadota bacterium]
MEPHDIRLKRLLMRSNYRGIKEMDIIMGGFAKTHLAQLMLDEIDIYEQLLSENDHDIYAWILGTADTPDPFKPLIGKLKKHAEADF